MELRKLIRTGKTAQVMVAFGLLGISSASAAGTVFNLAGSLNDGSSFSGTLTIDTATVNSNSAILGSNIAVTGTTADTCVGPQTYGGSAGVAGYFFGLSCVSGNIFQLTLITTPGGFLTGYPGGAIATAGSDSHLGTIGVASGNVSQTAAPSISKAFSPTEFAPGSNSALSLTITNPNSGTTLNGVAFTDTLPTGMAVATPNGLVSSCGGTVTATAGASAVSLSGGSIAGGGNCTVTVNVTASEGIYNNFVQVTSTNGGTGNTAFANAIVAFGPALTKTFGATSIVALGSTSMTFSMTNPNQFLTLNSIAFSDALPAGLVISTPSGLAGSCGGGIINVTSGGVSLSGATLAPGAGCTFSMNVSSDGTVTGLLVNTTSPVTSVVGDVLNCAGAIRANFQGMGGRSAVDCGFAATDPTGPPATAHLFIGVPFQVNYAANLNFGESYIDIGNAGSNGAPPLGPGFGAAAGNICVNVYAFDPSEELIACCSCLVTPGQTVHLGVNADLTSKTLTGVIPTSVTIKLLTTLAGSGGSAASCNNTAASGDVTLANGTTAFRTTLHSTPLNGSFATTETQFTPSTLSAGELASITGRCASIMGNASGFGICNSCRSGALGGSKL